MDIYMPREDTELILKYVKDFAKGNVLDMGTGSGILGIYAAKQPSVKHVICVDINRNALNFAKTRAKGLENISFVYSDLFEVFYGRGLKFDLILFNPPYLPYDEEEPEEIRAFTTGGQKGYELIERFFSDVSDYLMPYGKILLVFSTLTGKEKVHSIIEEKGFNYQKIAEESFFYETIFLYVVEKSDVLNKLESKGISGLSKINKGQRGIIFKGKLEGKDVAVKVKNPESKAHGRIINEARWLKLLNLRGIGPKLLFHGEDYFCYEYVDGVFIEDFLKNAKKGEIKSLFKSVFDKCYVMDNMGVSKEEMHDPYKHILVSFGKPVMVDFERMHSTEKPKNVSQFVQYVTSGRIGRILKEKGFKLDKAKIRSASSVYKKDMTKKNLNSILKLIK